MAEQIDEYFTTTVTAMADHTGPGTPDRVEPVEAESGLSLQQVLELFDAQLGSRHLDLAARWLRSKGKGFYTIGSSGHEGNAVVARALRPTDPALLHYRSGGFFLQRARQVQGTDPLRDVLLGIVAATDEPISGGRHKVFGRRDLNVIPQTSTIASQLPRAVGVAFSTGRAAKLGVPCPWPADAVAVCSFGDASANHSTAIGAITTAIRAAYQRLPLPLLFVCEDNGIGISTKTPTGWIAANFGNREGLEYFAADGSDLPAAYATAKAAVDWVRAHRKPALLHLRTVRLMGHAGSDFEAAYRTPSEITADFDRDPVLCTAQLLIERGHLNPTEVLALYENKRSEVLGLAEQVSKLPQLNSAKAVMKPLLDGRAEAVAAQPRKAHPAHRSQIVGTPLPEDEGPLTLALAINRALLDVLTAYPEALIFGEDVAGKGGVYGVTRGLMKKIGSARSSTPSSTNRPSSGSPSAPVSPGCCRSRRSNTSPTCTTPPTRSAGRRDPAILLRPAIPQPHGGAHRRLRIPERFRRTLPQRQRHRRTARYPRHHHRLPGPPRRRRRHDAHLRRRRPHRRCPVRVPRTHCAVPHPGPAR
jgi:2-oxoisovalerate dehydrogenase E1 component